MVQSFVSWRSPPHIDLFYRFYKHLEITFLSNFPATLRLCEAILLDDEE